MWCPEQLASSEWFKYGFPIYEKQGLPKYPRTLGFSARVNKVRCYAIFPVLEATFVELTGSSSSTVRWLSVDLRPSHKPKTTQIFQLLDWLSIIVTELQTTCSDHQLV